MKEITKKKEAIVDEILNKMENAQSVVFIDYRGLTVAEDTELRNRFRQAGVDYHVTKNTMIYRAAEKLGMEALYPYLHGPTALAFGTEDVVAPAKIISDYIKEVNKTEVKCGVVEGKVVDPAAVKALASLPSREVLIAQVLGTMNAPIAGLATVLSGTIRNLLYTLNAICGVFF